MAKALLQNNCNSLKGRKMRAVSTTITIYDNTRFPPSGTAKRRSGVERFFNSAAMIAAVGTTDLEEACFGRRFFLVTVMKPSKESSTSADDEEEASILTLSITILSLLLSLMFLLLLLLLVLLTLILLSTLFGELREMSAEGPLTPSGHQQLY